jgi:Ala-tRNA(Pro) deacylase
MTTAALLRDYLAERGCIYDVVAHAPTHTSARTADASHVPAERLAKAVVLKDEAGYLVAVLPASHHIELGALENRLERSFAFATEDEIERLFPDCERGAVPPIAAPYGLKMIVDDSIVDQPEVYFEAGDHATIVHMAGGQFASLVAAAAHGRFSVHA